MECDETEDDGALFESSESARCVRCVRPKGNIKNVAAGGPSTAIVDRMEVESKTEAFDEVNSSQLLTLLSSENVCEGVPAAMRIAWREQTTAR